jgi:hypothetical protein
MNNIKGYIKNNYRIFLWMQQISGYLRFGILIGGLKFIEVKSPHCQVIRSLFSSHNGYRRELHWKLTSLEKAGNSPWLRFRPTNYKALFSTVKSTFHPKNITFIWTTASFGRFQTKKGIKQIAKNLVIDNNEPYFGCIHKWRV